MTDPPEYDPDPDDLTRAELADRPHLPWSALADVLDDWSFRAHGLTSSRHHVGLFLELAADRGLRVEYDPSPDVGALLPTPAE